MPDYTYPMIFPDLRGAVADNSRDLEVWLSANVISEDEGDSLWADISHTHADPLTVANTQTTGWTLPALDPTEITVHEVTAGLPSSGTVLVDVTVGVQVSGLTAGETWQAQLSVQDTLRGTPFVVVGSSAAAPAVTTESATQGGTVGSGTAAASATTSLVTATGSADSGTAEGTTGAQTLAATVYGETGIPDSAGDGHKHPAGTLYASGGSHSHSFSGAHTHTFTGVGHQHTLGDHTHTFTGAGHQHTVSGTSHSHAVPKSTVFLRWVGSVDVGSPAKVDIGVWAAASATAATVDKVQFAGIIWVIPPTLAAQLGGLDDLTDVSVPTPTDGYVLTWSESAGNWIAQSPLSDTNLALLGDVTISEPANNEVLAYDSGTSEWINQTAAEAGLAATGHDHAATYLGISAKAADSELLDSHDTAYFATADHAHAGTYLPLGGTATDSSLLGGYAASAFATAAHGHSGTYIPVIGSPAANHFPYQTLTGELADSGYDAADFATAAHEHALEAISNVTITDAADGEVLTWDSGTSNWVNAEAAAGEGGGGHYGRLLMMGG